MSSRHRDTLKTLARPAALVCILVAVFIVLQGCAHVRKVLGRPDVVIGTAGPSETDYPLGGSICRLFNLNTPRHGIRCAEELSVSTAANIEGLQKGKIAIGIVPSDVLAEALKGQGPFASEGPSTDLRFLFAGHADIFTLVAHQEAEINSLSDLRGKRIGIGKPGSRQRTSIERVMSAAGLNLRDFAQVRELAPAEQNRAFCENELDAIVYSVAHPNGLIRDAALTCHGRLVAVGGPPVDRILSQYKEYERVTIPGDTYPGNPEDISTFGMRAVVLTTTELSDSVAYEITSAVFDNFNEFRRLHPAFKTLSIEDMIRTSGGAPVHEGAVRYYREQGWLP